MNYKTVMKKVAEAKEEGKRSLKISSENLNERLMEQLVVQAKLHVIVEAIAIYSQRRILEYVITIDWTKKPRLVYTYANVTLLEREIINGRLKDTFCIANNQKAEGHLLH